MNEFKGNDQDTKDVITLKDMKGSVDDFMAECKDQELSGNTLIKYERVARLLIDHLSRDHNDSDPVTKKDMINWKTSLKHYEVKTQSDYVICANKFTRFCISRDIEDKQKCYLTLKNIKFQKTIQTDDDILTPNEIKRLKAAARKIGYDDVVLAIDIFVKSGIRFDALKFFTVDMLKGKNIIEVESKGKIIKVIIKEDLKREMRKYIKDHGIESGYLIPSMRDKNKPVSKSTMCKRLHRVAKVARVKKEKVHPHSFRHAFAKSLYREGASIATIKDILGHESVETTMIYLRLTTEELREAINNAKLNF